MRVEGHAASVALARSPRGWPEIDQATAGEAPVADSLADELPQNIVVAHEHRQGMKSARRPPIRRTIPSFAIQRHRGGPLDLARCLPEDGRQNGRWNGPPRLHSLGAPGGQVE